MPLVRVIVQSKPTPIEAETAGIFAGCPRTTCRRFLRRIKLPLFPKKVHLYGEAYETSGFAWRAFNRKRNYETFVVLDDEKLAQFIARAKAAGDHWKAEEKHIEVDACHRFSSFAAHI